MPRLAVLPNLAPARLDLTNYRGDTLTMRLVVRARGVPINITLWTFEAHIRTAVDAPVLATFDIFKIAPLVGEIRLALSSDQSQLLPQDSIWDLESIDPVGRTRTLVRGHIDTPPDITHPTTTRRA